MKRMAIVIVIATFSLLQQGCYTAASRKGTYYASTQYVWSHGSGLRTAGECIMLTGAMIPIVGWVTLVPAGGVINVAEHCVIAPVFDTVLLPADCLVNCSDHLRDEANYQKLQRRLESNFDATIADAAYWRNEGELRHLNRWLSQQEAEKPLAVRQLSAVLSLLEEGLTGNDTKKMCACLEIFNTLYMKANEKEEMATLANWLVDMKGNTKLDSALFKMALGWPAGSVKFDDEQLRFMRDAGIMPSEIDKILKRRQKKRDTESGQSTVQKL